MLHASNNNTAVKCKILQHPMYITPLQAGQTTSGRGVLPPQGGIETDSFPYGKTKPGVSEKIGAGSHDATNSTDCSRNSRNPAINTDSMHEAFSRSFALMLVPN
jgi:hypothetical protein